MQDTSTATIDKPRELDITPQVDWSVSPDKITEKLKRDGRLVITDNDRPVAVMINVDGSTVEDTLLDLRRLQMQKAIKTIQEASVRSGKSKMTLEEINAEIAAARNERRSREKTG